MEQPMGRTLYGKVKWECHRELYGSLHSEPYWEIRATITVYRATFDNRVGGYRIIPINTYGTVDTITQQDILGFSPNESYDCLQRLNERAGVCIERIQHLLRDFTRGK